MEDGNSTDFLKPETFWEKLLYVISLVGTLVLLYFFVRQR